MVFSFLDDDNNDKNSDDNNDDNNNGNRDNYFRTVTRSAPSAIIDEHRWEPFETPLATEECNKAMRKKESVLQIKTI